MKPLIPQRDPIVMVDDIVLTDDTHAHTTLLLTAEKYLSGEAALIEFAAQSCAALIGSRSHKADIGYIGEVRNFHIQRIPPSDRTLYCDLEIIAEMAGVSLVQVYISAEQMSVADGRLKLFIHE